MKTNKINYECPTLNIETAMNNLRTLIEKGGYDWTLVKEIDAWRSSDGTVKISATYKGKI